MGIGVGVLNLMKKSASTGCPNCMASKYFCIRKRNLLERLYLTGLRKTQLVKRFTYERFSVLAILLVSETADKM